jgi:two-component system response regulator ChvI
VRYREIYDVVRGSGFVAGAGEDGYRANVRAFIKRIRQKFREVDDGFDRIENYAGFGYRWRTEN